MLTLVSCPECRVPAEITERFRLPSTDGLVDHIVVLCAGGHYFRMAADRLDTREPSGQSSSRRPRVTASRPLPRTP
jgi:hypothetical protein